MKIKIGLIACFLTVFIASNGFAQTEKEDRLVQFTGMVLDGSDSELIPVPYANILVKGKNRGTYSDFNGFFSIVVEKGDAIEFSAVGYQTVEFVLPDTLSDTRYSLVQLMTRDTINLPETVVFPWPSREHFKLEFLAMDVSSEMQDIATENMAKESLERIQSGVTNDPRENANYYLRKQAREYYYIGQQPPMNIYNPIAWKQFFDAWKRGDFKKKKNKK